MRWFRLRPTFQIPLSESRASALEKIHRHHDPAGTDTLMFVHGEYGEFHLPPKEHRIWSPHLSFYVHDHDGRGVIHGRYAPRLEIWTLVWVAYLAMAFSAFFGLTLGYVQWTLGESAWGLWVGLAALLALLTIYLVAHVGQQWSDDQMRQLRQRLDEFLERSAVAIESSNGSGCANP